MYSLIILIDARQITPTPAEYIQTGIQPDQANRESNNDAEQMDDFSGQWNQAIDANGNDSNLLIVFYVQIMPDDLVMQLHRF
ncbi:hypothetical protein A3N50_09800 [Klebsiella aerogenes]|nr:hypothetical protein A3N50_09800 [Klebsiella aerogenes]